MSSAIYAICATYIMNKNSYPTILMNYYDEQLIMFDHFLNIPWNTGDSKGQWHAHTYEDGAKVWKEHGPNGLAYGSNRNTDFNKVWHYTTYKIHN